MPDVNIVSVTLPEGQVEGKRLGRHVKHDPRSLDFQAGLAPKIISVTHQATGLPLDQGKLGSCTANALCGALDSAPDFNGATTLNEGDAIRVYELETKIEGKPYPPNDPGGRPHGLQGSKTARHDHRLPPRLRHPACTPGPRDAPCDHRRELVQQFRHPDPQTGMVQLTAGATVRGGHEIVDGIDADKQLVWFWNSWGTQYGLGGRFCMTFDTWDRLLQEQGDVTVPVN